jgi:hypothetical protein
MGDDEEEDDEGGTEAADVAYGNGGGAEDDEDDDAEWYRREVGEEPAPELALKSGGGRAAKRPKVVQSENERAPAPYAKAAAAMRGKLIGGGKRSPGGGKGSPGGGKGKGKGK